MVNNSFRNYGYNEGTKFEGLNPKVMKELGEEYTIGKVDEPVVSIFNPTAKGVDQMEVIDVNEISKIEL